MYLKNKKKKKSNCYTYLGFKKGITDPKIDLLIEVYFILLIDEHDNERARII